MYYGLHWCVFVEMKTGLTSLLINLRWDVTISKLILVLMYAYRNMNSLTESYVEIIPTFLHSNAAYVIM